MLAVATTFVCGTIGLLGGSIIVYSPPVLEPQVTTPTSEPDVVTSSLWIDETGEVPLEILEALNSASSGKILVFGVFTTKGNGGTSRSLELGNEWGLVEYPDNQFPAVTIAITVVDGKATGFCYSVWQDGLQQKMEGVYYNQGIDEDDSFEGVVKFVQTLNSNEPLLVTLPSEIPEIFQDVPSLQTQGYFEWGYTKELVVVKATNDGWSRETVLIRDDSFVPWIEVRWFHAKEMIYTLRLYDSNMYAVNGIPVRVECLACAGELKYNIEVLEVEQ